MYRYFLLVIAAVVGLQSAPAYAEADAARNAPNAPSTDAVASPPPLRASHDYIHTHTLENGLTVIVIENHDVPIVTIEMAVKNGAFTENLSINGLSHLYEHMFFKANAVYPNQVAYMKRQRELGMVFNGTTGTERVNYFFTLPSNLLDQGLAFMSAAIQTPQFHKEELQREKSVVLGEYDRNQANPFWYLHRTTNDLLWPKYPATKRALGTREAIQNATVAKMQTMQDTYYVPNNSLLVISGDIDDAEGLALANKNFSGWKQAADPFVEHPARTHPALTKNSAKSVAQPIGVSVIQMAWHGPNTQDSVEDTYAADVFGYAVSQASSKLQHDLVDSGIALSASLSYLTQRHTGPITFTAVTTPGNEAKLIATMHKEIQQFAQPDYISDQLLETAKTVLSVQDLTLQQYSRKLAHTLSFWWASADIDYYLNYIDNLQKVSQKDIQRYVKRWIIDKPRTLVLLAKPDIAEQWTSERLLDGLNSKDAE